MSPLPRAGAVADGGGSDRGRAGDDGARGEAWVARAVRWGRLGGGRLVVILAERDTWRSSMVKTPIVWRFISPLA